MGSTHVLLALLQARASRERRLSAAARRGCQLASAVRLHRQGAGARPPATRTITPSLAARRRARRRRRRSTNARHRPYFSTLQACLAIAIAVVVRQALWAYSGGWAGAWGATGEGNVCLQVTPGR